MEDFVKMEDSLREVDNFSDLVRCFQSLATVLMYTRYFVDLFILVSFLQENNCVGDCHF